MNRETLSTIVKWISILAATLCVALALAGLSAATFSWGFLVLLAFATIVAPRMSLALPRSRFAISFSDAAVLLAFLYYGGSAAIVVAAVETLASCLYLRSRGFHFGRLMIPTNVANNALAMAVTYLIWLNMPTAPSAARGRHNAAPFCDAL